MADLKPDIATRMIVMDLRANRSLHGWCGGAEGLSEWVFSEPFRRWLADYLEQGNPIPSWLTAEHKVSPAVPRDR